MNNKRRKFIVLFGVIPLSLFSFRNIFAKSSVSSNKFYINKFRAKNRNAAISIKNAPYEEVVEESRRIAPLVSKVLRSIHIKIANEKISKLELQSHVIDKLEEYNLIPSMAGYLGFPASIAISVDSELVHNIPDNTVISPGALVTVEIGASSNTAYASQAWSFFALPVDQKKRNLYKAAKLALDNALKQVRDGSPLGNIGYSIQATIEEKGYNVVREYCGYGMGNERIQEPQILGYGQREAGPAMRAGQIFNIHVLATEGKRAITINTDGWGVKSKDGRTSIALSAMVLVEPKGYVLLSDIEI